MGQPLMNDFMYVLGSGRVRPHFDHTSHPRNGNGTNPVRQRAVSVQQFELFEGIPLADCMEIVAGAHEKQFVRRQTIFIEGDPVRQVILLLSGCVKITQLGPNGHEVILRFAGVGEIVGGMGRCSNCEHCSSARTAEPTTALVWEMSRFESVSEQFPHLRRNVAHDLERRLIDLEARFREISTEKVAPRLSSQLLRLLKQVGKKADGHIEVALSRRDLAQLTGTTLFTVSRLLCRWETQGIVSARRESVLVHNVSALTALSQQE